MLTRTIFDLCHFLRRHDRIGLHLAKLTGIAALAVLAGPQHQAQAWWDWTSDGSMFRRRFVDGLYQPVTQDPYSSAYYNHPAYRNYPFGGYRYGPGQPVTGFGYGYRERAIRSRY